MLDRTFVISDKVMKGDDVRNWQGRIKASFKTMRMDCPIKIDGVYGHHTRTYSAALCHSLGLSSGTAMKNGVTPELRTKIRHGVYTPAQKKLRHSKSRKAYRQKLREQWKPKKVHTPVSKILADSWGYHPGVHDGLDVICPPHSTLFAMCKARVIDVRSGGWWGKAPSGDVTKGDGIVQLEVLEDVGPFKRGMHIGYGHSENACVKKGQIVEAGRPIAVAGLAVAWHIHLMVNSGNTMKGVGTQDPRPLLDYAVKHG